MHCLVCTTSLLGGLFRETCLLHFIRPMGVDSGFDSATLGEHVACETYHNREDMGYHGVGLLEACCSCTPYLDVTSLGQTKDSVIAIGPQSIGTWSEASGVARSKVGAGAETGRDGGEVPIGGVMMVLVGRREALRGKGGQIQVGRWY